MPASPGDYQIEIGGREVHHETKCLVKLEKWD